MRYVQRGPEPPELTAYKACANADWTPTYRDFDQKPAVVLTLAREQGDLCGYCGSRIGLRDARGAWKKDCHIEHVDAQHPHAHRQLDHTNMLASCQGSDAAPPVPAHCGAKRGNTPLLVTPFMPDCGAYFFYGSDGGIGAVADPVRERAAEVTIRLLRLDIKRLKEARKAAIDAAIEGLDALSPDELRAEAATYDVPDTDGRLSPYCFAIQQVLLRIA
jgi:uncharacterized protein (TIGR02646 family)